MMTDNSFVAWAMDFVSKELRERFEKGMKDELQQRRTMVLEIVDHRMFTYEQNVNMGQSMAGPNEVVVDNAKLKAALEIRNDITAAWDCLERPKDASTLEDILTQLDEAVETQLPYKGTRSVANLVKNLKRELAKGKYWPPMPAWSAPCEGAIQGPDDKPIPEDKYIDLAFPTRSERHDLYAHAMRLVGAKYSKGALVALVNWLLHRAEEAKAEK